MFFFYEAKHYISLGSTEAFKVLTATHRLGNAQQGNDKSFPFRALVGSEVVVLTWASPQKMLV